MSIQIVSDNHYKCLVDTSTSTALSIVFTPDEYPLMFLEWLSHDARIYSSESLHAKLSEWRSIVQEFDSHEIAYDLLECDMEDVDDEDYPKFTDAFIDKAWYRGVALNDEQLLWLNKQT